jgi:hypothetical protein
MRSVSRLRSACLNRLDRCRGTGFLGGWFVPDARYWVARTGKFSGAAGRCPDGRIRRLSPHVLV